MIKDGNVFCNKCGRLLGQGETVCPECGTPVPSKDISSSNICSVLSVLVLICGIAGSIYLAYCFGVKYELSDKAFQYESVRDIGKTIAILVSGSFSTIILYAILATLGEIKAKLDIVLK